MIWIPVGVVLIGIGLREIFNTLVRPWSKGTIGWLVERAVWRFLHVLPGGAPLEVGGPLIVVATVFFWVLLLTVGWAFIYWPLLPEGFSIAPALAASGSTSFVDAVYVSLVTLATLGYGDVTPVDGWLQLAAPLQAAVGFVLLSAAISWLVSLFPAVRRQWTLARQVAIAYDLRDASGNEPSENWLETLAQDIVGLSVELEQFPTAYYFRPRAARSALPLALARMLGELEMDDGAALPPPAAILHDAIAELLAYVAARFLGNATLSPKAAVRRYSLDHRFPHPPG